MTSYDKGLGAAPPLQPTEGHAVIASARSISAIHLTLEQMIRDRRAIPRVFVHPLHRRGSEEMPELPIEVRLVVVGLEVSAPIARPLRAQPAIAVLEPDD